MRVCVGLDVPSHTLIKTPPVRSASCLYSNVTLITAESTSKQMGQHD